MSAPTSPDGSNLGRGSARPRRDSGRRSCALGDAACRHPRGHGLRCEGGRTVRPLMARAAGARPIHCLFRHFLMTEIVDAVIRPLDTTQIHVSAEASQIPAHTHPSKTDHARCSRTCSATPREDRRAEPRRLPPRVRVLRPPPSIVGSRNPRRVDGTSPSEPQLPHRPVPSLLSVRAGKCPWADCSCGAACKCGNNCKCGSKRR